MTEQRNNPSDFNKFTSSTNTLHDIHDDTPIYYPEKITNTSFTGTKLAYTSHKNQSIIPAGTNILKENVYGNNSFFKSRKKQFLQKCLAVVGMTTTVVGMTAVLNYIDPLSFHKQTNMLGSSNSVSTHTNTSTQDNGKPANYNVYLGGKTHVVSSADTKVYKKMEDDVAISGLNVQSIQDFNKKFNIQVIAKLDNGDSYTSNFKPEKISQDTNNNFTATMAAYVPKNANTKNIQLYEQLLDINDKTLSQDSSNSNKTVPQDSATIQQKETEYWNNMESLFIYCMLSLSLTTITSGILYGKMKNRKNNTMDTTSTATENNATTKKQRLQRRYDKAVRAITESRAYEENVISQADVHYLMNNVQHEITNATTATDFAEVKKNLAQLEEISDKIAELDKEIMTTENFTNDNLYGNLVQEITTAQLGQREAQQELNQ